MKRVFDILLSAPALLLLSPLMIIVSAWVKLDSKGPIIYRQERVGRGGCPFFILKFRTMVESEVANELQITADSDARITRSGRLLRGWKLDELPQLINVLRGEMSVVGPRPEVRKYVDLYPETSRAKILSVRPGITDNASIEYRDEGRLLANAGDPERTYIEDILPVKIRMYEHYVDNRSLAGDVAIIFKTVGRIIAGR